MKTSTNAGFLEGYKTYLGACGVALASVGKALSDWYYTGSVDVYALIAGLGAALAIVGIRVHL